VAPREDFPRIGRSRALKPQDDQDGVWAVPCFFIHKGHRGEGFAVVSRPPTGRRVVMRKQL
jgi:hypothetical protein